jgi:beta-barrel assembly-enhancing protease
LRRKRHPRWKRRAVLHLAPLLVALVSQASDAELACPSEQQRARTLAGHIAQEWPIRGSGDYVSRYVQSLGDRLAARAAKARPGQWHFVVLRDRSANAFSIGDGRVYVTEGALLFARDESEMAAILAHEIGHQIAGHFCPPPPSSGSALGDLRERLFSKRQNDRVEMEIGSLVQVIDEQKEREADSHAVQVLTDAGYDARAMLRVARRLAGSAGIGHWHDGRRVQALERLVADSHSRYVHSPAEFLRVRRALAAE